MREKGQMKVRAGERRVDNSTIKIIIIKPTIHCYNHELQPNLESDVYVPSDK